MERQPFLNGALHDMTIIRTAAMVKCAMMEVSKVLTLF
jgi:hypothetical protein